MYKKIFEGKKAITFDLDGTLVDTIPLWSQACDEICTELGVIWPGFSEFLGLPLADVWKRVLSLSSVEVENSPEELTQRTHERVLQLLDNVELEFIDGFWDLAYTLKSEKGCKLALVTNSKKDIVDKVFAKAGISKTFDVIITSEDVSDPKPSPRIYKLACKQLGVKASEVLAFEDSPAGALSAHNAGLDVVVIWNGGVARNAYPETVKLFASSYRSLPENIDKNFDDVLKDAADTYLPAFENHQK